MCMPTLSIFFGPVTNSISHCTQILLQIFNPHKAPNGILNDYCDGSNFAQHEVFSKDPHALQVQLYYDDIDICNPIGSKSVIHKLGKFTITMHHNDILILLIRIILLYFVQHPPCLKGKSTNNHAGSNS